MPPKEFSRKNINITIRKKKHPNQQKV